jgi:hypothetical protein
MRIVKKHQIIISSMMRNILSLIVSNFMNMMDQLQLPLITAIILIFTPVSYGGTISVGGGDVGPTVEPPGIVKCCIDNARVPSWSMSGFYSGAGAQETASQMLYQRTSSITNALDRRMRDYTDYNQSKINDPYWIDS